jgi:hypothetical protein
MGIALVLLTLAGCTACVSGSYIAGGRREKLLEEKGYGIMEEYVKSGVVSHSIEYYGLAESGYDGKLLTLNQRGEFSYLNLEIPDRPRLEVITPGFPGVGGELGSDAENRVGWIIRGRGVYFIDLDSKKTGHMVAGNYGRVEQVLCTDKERLLFAVVTISWEASILYAYDLSANMDQKVGADPVSTYNALGKNRVFLELQDNKEMPQYNGWFLTDTFKTNIKAGQGAVLAGSDPLTKALTDNHVHAVNASNKLLHQGKRLLFAWSYITNPGTPIQPVLVRWSEDLQDITIYPIALMKRTEKYSYSGGVSIISGNGNWLREFRSVWVNGARIGERVMFHLQDYYPGGISTPVSLGYTNQDPGAFMNHSKLGPCYVEENTNQDGILFIFKLNGAVDILKRRVLGAASGLTNDR